MKRTAHLKFALIVALFAASAAPVHAEPLYTVDLRVDGRDELIVRDREMVIQHYEWSHPANLVLDGVPTPIAWTGNTSASMDVPLSGQYWVRKTQGRDSGFAVQLPDGFKLAVSDNANGADNYGFEFRTQPGEMSTQWMRVRASGHTPGLMQFHNINGYDPQLHGTVTTFSLAVDGTDELRFVDGALVIRHVRWSRPHSLSINGIATPITWNGAYSDPIPVSLPPNFLLEQTDGRSSLLPVHTPIGLVVGADDVGLGADFYAWQVVAMPEPTSGLMVAGLAGLLLCRRARRCEQRRGA